MYNLFFSGMEEVGQCVLASSHVFLALDYDGTLTPIVRDPINATLTPSMRHLLSALGRRSDARVAIVSGRAVADLQEMVDIPHLIYAGNHGMEIAGPGLRFIEPVAKGSAPLLHELGLELAGKLRHIRGAIVEDKGLTLTIHHRRAASVDTEEVWHTVHRAVEPVSERFQVTGGAKVFEVRPRVRWDKGAAVTWIKEQLGTAHALVIFIGDDVTDEDAFVALAGNAVTIKVGDAAATTAARYVLPSPAEVHSFLCLVNALLQTKKGE